MLNKLTKWGRSCGLEFNPTKTVAVYFSHSRKVIQHKLKIDNTYINYSDTVMYLGVKLDNKLSWKEHIDFKEDALFAN